MKVRILSNLLFFFISTLMCAQTSVWSDSANFYLENIKSKIPSTDSTQFAYADKAEVYARKSGNDSLMTMASYLKGVLYYYKGYHKVSNSYYFKALHSPEAVNEPNLQYRLLNNIGINYDMIGDYKSSLSYYQKALEIERKINDPKGMAQSRINIGRLYRVTQDFEKSMQELLLALDYFKAAPDDYYLGLIYQNINSLLIDQRADEQKVVMAYDSAMHYYNKISYQYGILELYNNLGEYYIETGNKTEALMLYNKALDQLENQPERKSDPQLLLNMAHLAFDDNNTTIALRKSEESYQSALLTGNLIQQINALYLMSDIYLKQDNSQKIYDVFNKIDQLHDSINKQEKNESYVELSILYELNEKTQHIINQELELKNSNTRELLLILSLVFLLLLFLFIVFFLRYRHNKLKDLYLKNRELVDLDRKNISQSDRVMLVREMEAEIGQLEQLYRETLRLMHAEKLFQNSSLTIDDVVAKVGTNQKYLSQAINQYHKGNFNTFLNSFRVSEAKRLIMDAKNTGYSLEQIMSKAGFQSRSTFTAAFKKQTGMTPGEFQKMDRENHAFESAE